MTLARSLEAYITELALLVQTSAGTGCRLQQSALVRMISKAVGMGGGMPSLLMRPLLSALENAVSANPMPLDLLHSLLVVCVPLLKRAAIKAEMLDQRMAKVLAQLLHGMVQAWDKSDKADLVRQATYQVLCHLILDALGLLCKPAVRVLSQAVLCVHDNTVALLHCIHVTRWLRACFAWRDH